MRPVGKRLDLGWKSSSPSCNLLSSPHGTAVPGVLTGSARIVCRTDLTDRTIDVLMRKTLLLVFGIALSLPPLARADAVVTFNEIMYHPATNEPAMEWGLR